MSTEEVHLSIKNGITLAVACIFVEPAYDRKHNNQLINSFTWQLKVAVPAEKDRRVSTKLVSLTIVRVHLRRRKLSIIRSSGVSTVQEYWSEGRTVGTFGIVRYIMGVHCWGGGGGGCLLIGVPLCSIKQKRMSWWSKKNKLKIVSIVLFVATYVSALAVKTLNNSAKNLFPQHAKLI